MASRALRDTTLIGVVALLDGLMETGWVAGAIIQASDGEGLNWTTVKEELSRKKAAAVWPVVRFRCSKPGGLDS